MLDDVPSTSFADRVEVGRVAEDAIIVEFLSAGWSILPAGVSRPNSPPPRLLTPQGEVRPVDLLAWHPDGRTVFVVEAKGKKPLIYLDGWGMDRSEDGADPWRELQRHDQRAGPVLVVCHDPDEGVAYAATVRMLAANGGPNVTRNGRYWWWPRERFMPLSEFLKL